MYVSCHTHVSQLREKRLVSYLYVSFFNNSIHITMFAFLQHCVRPCPEFWCGEFFRTLAKHRGYSAVAVQAPAGCGLIIGLFARIASTGRHRIFHPVVRWFVAVCEQEVVERNARDVVVWLLERWYSFSMLQFAVLWGSLN